MCARNAAQGMKDTFTQISTSPRCCTMSRIYLDVLPTSLTIRTGAAVEWYHGFQQGDKAMQGGRAATSNAYQTALAAHLGAGCYAKGMHRLNFHSLPAPGRRFLPLMSPVAAFNVPPLRATSPENAFIVVKLVGRRLRWVANVSMVPLDAHCTSLIFRPWKCTRTQSWLISSCLLADTCSGRGGAATWQK